MRKQHSKGRPLRLTAELVARVERLEPDPGPEPGTSEHSDAEFTAWAQALLDEQPAGELWVFAYGSLIWSPEFAFEESRRAIAHGWHRAFCFRLTRWRGTRELPALMLALDRGGSCSGVAYRLPAGDRAGQVAQLLRREVDAKPATNVPRWLQVRTSAGLVRALAFVAAPYGLAYAGRLPLPQVARVLARAAGHWGSAAQYLFNTVTALEQHGIHDRNLHAIQRMVAAEIAALPARHD
ncbi:gamma-glutamylcyclotransferase [Vogesella sp. LIG4]|uniref:gamma-glutamylcyclotransferase n=1 Tax=Vogesella sp. LIG4 TaxID=1192162 RepID=UPI00081FEA6A|nr:gamma-glutamylcyclotransferase [Vogesella sp. LIG4]SCK25548.1 cation transport protein ChaC [Vogesella sp. LIG4]